MVSARAYHAAYQVSVTGELIHLSWQSERLVISINQAAWCSCGPATVNNRCNPLGKHGELRYCVMHCPNVMSAVAEDERLWQDGVDLGAVSRGPGYIAQISTHSVELS